MAIKTKAQQIDDVKADIQRVQNKKVLKGGRSKLTRGHVSDILHIYKDKLTEEGNIRAVLSDPKLGISEDEIEQVISDLGSYARNYE